MLILPQKMRSTYSATGKSANGLMLTSPIRTIRNGMAISIVTAPWLNLPKVTSTKGLSTFLA